MDLLKQMLNRIHAEYDSCYDQFTQHYCVDDDELYDSLPDPYPALLLTFEEKYYKAEDYEDYENKKIKPNVNQLAAIRELAYDLYVVTWLLSQTTDRLMQQFYEIYSSVYSLTAYFAASRDLKELKNAITSWDEFSYDNLGFMKAIDLIEHFYLGRLKRTNMLFSKSCFMEELMKIGKKED